MDPDARTTFKNGGGYKPNLRNEAIGVPDGDGLRDTPPPLKKRMQTVHSEIACSFFFSLFFAIEAP